MITALQIYYARRFIMQKGLLKIVPLATVLCMLISTLPVGVCTAAEKYPSRSIDFMCFFAPGGMMDLLGRALGKGMEKRLGTAVVPVYKAGGGGVVGMMALMNTRPDGYTMGATGLQYITAKVFGQANYSFEDFRVVGQFGTFSLVLGVSADAPWKTMGEFIDYARKNPGLRYAHPGVGSAGHTRMENLNRLANLGMIGVPFNGDAETIPAVLGKHVPIGICSAYAVKSQADQGKMRILLSFEPPAEIGFSSTLPDVSTAFGQSVADKDVEQLLIVLVPGKTPLEIVRVLGQALEKAMVDPEYVSVVKQFNIRSYFVDGNTFMQQKLPKVVSRVEAIKKDLGLK